MSDERAVKLQLLSICNGDLDRAQRAFEWASGDDFERGFRDGLRGLGQTGASDRYENGNEYGSELYSLRKASRDTAEGERPVAPPAPASPLSGEGEPAAKPSLRELLTDKDGWMPIAEGVTGMTIKRDTEFKCADGNIRQRRVPQGVGALELNFEKEHLEPTHYRDWKPALDWSPYYGLTPPSHAGYHLETTVREHDGQNMYRYVPTDAATPHEPDVVNVADMSADELNEMFESAGLTLSEKGELAPEPSAAELPGGTKGALENLISCARQEGRNAFHEGVRLCPYPSPGEMHDAWWEGFEAEKTQDADEYGEFEDHPGDTCKPVPEVGEEAGDLLTNRSLEAFVQENTSPPRDILRLDEDLSQSGDVAAQAKVREEA